MREGASAQDVQDHAVMCAPKSLTTRLQNEQEYNSSSEV